MGMESTSLSRTLKTMEDYKLIERVPNPDDGRGVLIQLTTFGIEMRDTSKAFVMKFNNVIIKKIGKKNIDNFFNVMEEINKLIKNKEIF